MVTHFHGDQQIRLIGITLYSVGTYIVYRTPRFYSYHLHLKVPGYFTIKVIAIQSYKASPAEHVTPPCLGWVETESQYVLALVPHDHQVMRMVATCKRNVCAYTPSPFRNLYPQSQGRSVCINLFSAHSYHTRWSCRGRGETQLTHAHFSSPHVQSMHGVVACRGPSLLLLQVSYLCDLCFQTRVWQHYSKNRKVRGSPITNIFHSVLCPLVPEVFRISGQIPEIHEVQWKYAAPHSCEQKTEDKRKEDIYKY